MGHGGWSQCTATGLVLQSPHTFTVSDNHCLIMGVWGRDCGEIPGIFVCLVARTWSVSTRLGLSSGGLGVCNHLLPQLGNVSGRLGNVGEGWG